MRRHDVEHIGARGDERIGAHALPVERDLDHAPHPVGLIEPPQTRIPRVLHGIGGFPAEQLHEHVVEHLRAGADDDAAGVDLHSTGLPQVTGQGLTQTPRSGSRRGQEDLVLRLLRERTPQGARPQGGGPRAAAAGKVDGGIRPFFPRFWCGGP